MYEAKKTQTARYGAAASRLARLCREPVVEGSLCRVARGGAERYQLTDKVAGKSRTVYVPKGDAEDVRRWTENWREAKRLLLEMSGVMREIIRENAAAGGGRKGPTRKSSPGPS